MTKNGLRVLDSDMHIMEPPDLSERYIDREFKHRAPRGVTSANVRDLRMIYPDGRDWGTPGNRAQPHFLKLPIAGDPKRKILWDNCASYYAL